MGAVIGGLGAALCWAIATLCGSRSSRIAGSAGALAWALVVGLLVVLPFWLGAANATLSGDAVALIAVAGLGNVGGLLLEYQGFRAGPVGVVASLASVEGAIAALIAIIGGEPAPAVLFAVTPVLLVGLVLVTIQPETSHYSPQQWTAAVGYGVGAGAMFGASLYATGRVAESLPAVWAVVPSRFTGVVFLFLPLLVLGRVRIPRAAIPWVVGSGVADTAGFAFFALGSHSAIAVAAVLASQFAVLATVMAALVFRERLTPRQNVGVAVVALGVASVAALRAATA